MTSGPSYRPSSVLRVVLIIGLSAACTPMRGCKESGPFHIAPDSRLPRWFLLPTGVERQDVDVEMTYYISILPHAPGMARFVLRSNDGRKLAEVSGTTRTKQPMSLARQSSTGPISYPVYEVITSGVITEIIEHRRYDAQFYVTDDALVHQRLEVR
jgi:hypothetical protein